MALFCNGIVQRVELNVEIWQSLKPR